ncbi:uncharacterized protein BKA78DRAFT_357860 [Phyllosticta capitalensis]|uniref:Uncharacterized protein n=1 Tax=Phyllosticta capitalensis TaxID=121624 RepID=A0ABR1Y8N4_9PEZI
MSNVQYSPSQSRHQPQRPANSDRKRGASHDHHSLAQQDRALLWQGVTQGPAQMPSNPGTTANGQRTEQVWMPSGKAETPKMVEFTSSTSSPERLEPKTSAPRPMENTSLTTPVSEPTRNSQEEYKGRRSPAALPQLQTAGDPFKFTPAPMMPGSGDLSRDESATVRLYAAQIARARSNVDTEEKYHENMARLFAPLDAQPPNLASTLVTSDRIDGASAPAVAATNTEHTAGTQPRNGLSAMVSQEVSLSPTVPIPGASKPSEVRSGDPTISKTNTNVTDDDLAAADAANN